MSVLIGVTLFNNLLKSKNNLVLSFFATLIFMYLSKSVFAARNQIFSFLIFELEINCLIGLLEEGKKRNFWFLLLLAIALVLVHDTLYILYFVLILPYLADFIINKIFNLDDSFRFRKSNLKNIKYLIILIILAIPIGFLTPVFASTYTNLINCMNGASTEIINELKPVELMKDYRILTVIFLAVGLLFTKTKFKIKDVLFVFGFIAFALMANRNVFFLYLIGSIFLTNMVTDTMNTYIGEEKVINGAKFLENSKILMISIFCFTSIVSIKNFTLASFQNYVNEFHYPVEATDYILKNEDYKNMRIWTSFNWGSYLEMKGIKVYIDSRSGMYTEQENKGCSVLVDWYNVSQDRANYEEIFEKYKISDVLVETSDELYNKLEDDNNYEKTYSDTSFALFKRKSIN